ncbi:hypothetical protein [Cytobacillus pseudoceanisediminis]|uniref:hypothetical protein n=1 Tax=Cytobacillus pseudoceanisediminis TaxID=3051614 RepID=UPI003C2FDBE4
MVIFGQKKRKYGGTSPKSAPIRTGEGGYPEVRVRSWSAFGQEKRISIGEA